MNKIDEIAKRSRILWYLYARLREGISYFSLKSKSAESVFTEIYKNNGWHGLESVSGTGSGQDQTKRIKVELRTIFDELKIESMLDIPCGDFCWMNGVDLKGVDYLGADIVRDLIKENSHSFSSDRVRFQQLDLIGDPLPKVDLVFCRDCLVHFSFHDISLALDNICRSESTYLMTTTFTKRKKNRDIATGQWRVLNLQLAPFGFPVPLKVMSEGCTEGGGAYDDKSLGLWKIADLREAVVMKRKERQW